ncbi:hypothetical protein ACHAXT_005239 [Thalassiosira profunda]
MALRAALRAALAAAALGGSVCAFLLSTALAAVALGGSAGAFQPSPSSRACRPRSLREGPVDLQTSPAASTDGVAGLADGGVVDIPPTPTEAAARRARSQKARETWSTIALHPTSRNQGKEIPLDGESTVVHNQRLFDEFCKVKGTYFMNGLASCQIGDRLVHPFEAHGHCKSLVFDGSGKMYFTTNIVETPLAKKERGRNKLLNRGVMSTVSDMDSLWGNIRNALSSSERDTANLTADLWPPPSTKNLEGIEPMLITCTDNGEPYALDPKTLEMKGRLVDVVPKLKAVFPEGSKFLAHTRYDEERGRFVMCRYKMVIPGDEGKGNTEMEFVEFDDNFDVVSKREFTTRFIVFHDWQLTDNYYVVPKNPAYLRWDNILQFVLGLKLGTDVFAMEEETNGEFILIPRHDANEEVHEVQSDAFFNCFHFGPVFERKEANELVVNGCVFDSYTFGGEMGFDGENQQFSPIEWGSVGLASNGAQSPPPRLDKFVIDTNTFQIKSKERVPVIPIDMPSFNGDTKPCRYSYFLGASRPEGWFPFRQIVKLDLDTYESFVYDAGEDQVVSEPMFIPRSNPTSEDDGFVVSLVHDAPSKNARLMVWDSQTFQEGPIAECSLSELFPWAVHGSFVPNYNP